MHASADHLRDDDMDRARLDVIVAASVSMSRADDWGGIGSSDLPR